MALISLGCPKNLVDSEVLLARLAGDGIPIVPRPEDASVVIVNTCAFVQEAREEAIETLLDMVRLKEEGRLQGIVAVGCLPQRYRDRLVESLPEVDAFLPLTDYSGLPQVVRRVAAGKGAGPSLGGRTRSGRTDRVRLLLTPPSHAYLRIAEGCDHACAFCAIPSIRGPLRSKPLGLLLEEARGLLAMGVRELVLVAEDTTAWGKDLRAEKRRLPDLLAALDGLPGLVWVRVLYGHPGSVDGALLEALASLPRVAPYLDLPIQHIDPAVLAAMRRGGGKRLEALLHRIRERVPGIALRTSILVGHPGETERRFARLLEFLAEFRFERLGAFAFSPEEGTPAARLAGRPSRAAAARRLGLVMEAQREIVHARNRELVGGLLPVLVDGALEQGILAGRTHADAPDVDCLVRIEKGAGLKAGDFPEIRITGYAGYDLIGEPAAGKRPARSSRGARA